MTTKIQQSSVIDPSFIYLNWRKDIANPKIHFLKDTKDSVTVQSTVGPYKNTYS